MCPTDTTPDPRDMLRAPDEPEFMQPRPDPRAEAAEADASLTRPVPGQSARAADIDARPPLPTQPEITAADIEDEEADPVGSDSSGVAELGQSDSVLQRG